MSKIISDNTPTSAVVWAAAERIGKTGNRDELERIGDYLIKYVPVLSLTTGKVD